MVQAVLLSGKRGSGKSISAVRLMHDYLSRGCVVATNMVVFPDKLCGPMSRSVIYRLPDVPSLFDFESLPLGNDNPVNESKNGLLVLDEVGTFLNSREWAKKDRGGVISWFLHSRKFGWDLCLIAQHPRLVDAQIRDGLCELSAVARRLDNVQIPFFGQFLKLLGIPFRLPRFHLIIFRYGFGLNAPQSDVWFFSGKRYHDCYDSLQQISSFNEDVQGTCCFLPGWHLKGRYMSWFDRTKKALILSFSFGFSLCFFIFLFYMYLDSRTASSLVVSEPELPPVVEGVTVVGVSRFNHASFAVLSDGQVGLISSESFNSGTRIYQVNGNFYRGQ
jgi:hypothetical protein